MQIKSYLEKYQPVIYQTFVNSIQTNKLSHAYLLVGNPGTPLLDTAKYLAKSIICDDKDPLACNSCITCMRMDDNNYTDFILLDGSKGTIKKEEISALESRFEKKAFEAKGVMIYLLHLVENMTVEAINAILKFLEEPECEVYAFLTTNNINNILPTIASRCQILHLKQVDRTDVIDEAVDMGVNKEDAELLSYFYNNSELIYDFLADKNLSDDYYEVKTAVLEYFTSIIEEDRKKGIFTFQSRILPLVKTKEQARYLIDILISFFEDLVRKSNRSLTIMNSYDTILDGLLNKLTHINESLVELLKDRSLINSNVNISLLLNHIDFVILREDE